MYTVRRLNIGKTEQLDELASASGELYSRVVVLFWRTVRKKGVWLKPSSLMRWQNSDRLHAHTADACAQAFFSSLKSYRARCKTDPDAKPPHERRKFFRVEYKSTAMRHKGDTLTLSNGRGNPPLVLPWTWETPKTLTIHWTGTQYEAIAVYVLPEPKLVQDGRTAGVDLGEIHLAVSHDGDHTHIINGRLLRAKRQYQNRIKARLSHMIDTKKRGSRRRERLIQSKKRQLRKLDNQIKDITHKCTTRLVSTLREDGVQTVVIGEVRDIRQGLDYGKKANQ